MKLLLLLLSGFLILSAPLRAQQVKSPAAFETYDQAWEKEFQALYDAKKYPQALAQVAAWQQAYATLPAATQHAFRRVAANVSYNAACCAALQQDHKQAVAYFGQAVASGYHDYTHAKADPDFAALRQDKAFQQQLAAIRQYGDYVYILQQAQGYAAQPDKRLPAFTYQAATDPHLAALRSRYQLDSIAGQGSEASRYINLLHWVHEQVPHDGNHENPAARNAQDLLRVCRAEKRGLNCRGLATILNEVYLAMGYQSRFVGCLPKDTTDQDSHVINAVYSPTQQKWLWMDPTNDAYVLNEKGELLSIEEVRARILDGRPLLLNPTANWNHKVSKTNANYLYSYMAKNLYKLQSPVSSQYDLETRTAGKTIAYITLLPTTVNTPPKPVRQTQAGPTSFTLYTTSSAASFWQKP